MHDTQIFNGWLAPCANAKMIANKLIILKTHMKYRRCHRKGIIKKLTQGKMLHCCCTIIKPCPTRQRKREMELLLTNYVALLDSLLSMCLVKRWEKHPVEKTLVEKRVLKRCKKSVWFLMACLVCGAENCSRLFPRERKKSAQGTLSTCVCICLQDK